MEETNNTKIAGSKLHLGMVEILPGRVFTAIQAYHNADRGLEKTTISTDASDAENDDGTDCAAT